VMVAGWAGCLFSSLLTAAGSLALGLATAVWRAVDMLPGYAGTGLLAAVAAGLAVWAGWTWLDHQLAALPEAWLPDRRG